MTGVRSLDEKGKSTIAEMLARLHPSDGLGTVGTVDGLTRVGERLRVLSGAAVPLVSEEQEEQLVVPEAKPEIPVYTPPQQLPQDSGFVGLGTPVLGVTTTVPSAEDLKAVLLSSYRDFRSSISKVASLPLPESTPGTPSAVVVTADENDAQEDLVLSKTQCELTLEEGKVWDEFTLATSKPMEITTLPPSLPPGTSGPTTLALDNFILSAVEDRLDALTNRSEVVADSYQRRMCVPTKNTYSESREILEAMGVPCYEIEGEHEGEALASSLVLRGLADYVVSEDSVRIYCSADYSQI